jgi:hypothetical protein
LPQAFSAGTPNHYPVSAESTDRRDPAAASTAAGGGFGYPPCGSAAATDGVLSVPGSVVIPKGQSSASFSVTTVPVDSDTDVSIVASLGTSQVFGTVTLTP